MASKGSRHQQQSTDGLVKKEAQEPAAGAMNEIPELRRGYPVPRGRYLASDLPPLHKLADIFADMASNALKLGFASVLSRLGSRPLRVATMCSGTEAPLLALELIQTGLGMNQQLRISHAFSCEIVPLKQSYIERNFRPHLLFRDITELGGEKARTAYGSSKLIPGDLDIVVAGTACVDFSSLNNRKKTLQQCGESGATFDGLLRYAERYRPRMVIQENVRNAPWEQMKGKWEELGYLSVLVTVDTKQYYIPQTRERGYLVVIDKRRLEAAGLIRDSMDQSDINNVAQRVRELACQFKRQASAPVGMFLLNDDDRRLELIEMRARLDSRSDTSWEQYQVRHQRHRDDLELGNERPITRSLPGINVLKAPDFYWHRFWKTQPERVWETVDMNFLKRLAQSYDMNFKERWIDLSQGVDRGNDSLAGSGIAGCLTPKGIPFVTTRGGPVSGTEALALQGLPLDRMLLTRETQAELMDMAGNAMTSTVVCAIMLASLIAVHPILGTDDEGSTQPDDDEAKPLLNPNEDYSLARSTLQVTECHLVNHDVFKAKAASSVLCCSCERQTGVQDNIHQCTLCGHTACNFCRGNPTHSYSPLPLSRQEPSEFIANIKGLVPMILILSGLSESEFETFKSLYPTDFLPDFWDGFIDRIKITLQDAFRFLEIKRGKKWRVVYNGTHSSLCLDIGPDSIQWLLYAKPPESAPTKSTIREVLAKPIARMTPNEGSLIDGKWEVCSPVSTPFSLQISGQNNQVRSFEAQCGLKVAKFAEGKVWTTLLVEGSDEDLTVLDLDVRGLYQYLPDCGTALGALYRRPVTANKPAIFLFLDPTKTGKPDDDTCVFAIDHSRLPGYEVRITIAELTPNWRSLDVTPISKDVKAFCRRWVKAPEAQLIACAPEQMKCDTLQQGIQVSIANQNCHNACITLASLSAPAAILKLPNVEAHWQAWDPEASTRELKGLAWLFSKIAAWSDFEDWNDIICPGDPSYEHDVDANCNVCNPPSPSITWGRDKNDRITPYENPQEAAIYERAVKSQPSPFLIFRRINGFGDAELRFTLNIQALTHLAHGKLAGIASREKITSQWRLLPHAYDMAKEASSRFSLMSNSNDIPSPQPPNFKCHLRDEQLRSLSWMISQEAETIEPFTEEEVEESVLPLMPWRAEVKATIPHIVRGGVLADEVGYGKTAIVLGLIDSQYEEDCKIPPENDGLIPTNATLIIVPSNVFKQWVSEIDKFVGAKYQVLAVESIKKISIQQVQDADIVLMSWSVLANDTYYNRLQRFTGTPKAPARSGGGTGRNFDSWFHDASASLRECVETLSNEGPEAMLHKLEARRHRVQETQADFTYVPSKRLRGQAFADANAARDHNVVVPKEDLSSESDSGYEESDLSDGRPNMWKRRRSEKPQNGPGEKRRNSKSTEPAEASVDNKQGPKTKSEPNDRKDFNITNVKEQDWRTVKAAFVHAFSFKRLVIDEYTYAGEDRQVSLLSLHARSKWILSGTPALDDFADIKSIARYLGLHLGVDDDGDRATKNKRLRTIRKNHTAVEAFQMYQVPHSNAWYKNRRLHAQKFLDRFARQNMAKIKRIELITNLDIIGQIPTEKAAYNTLFQAFKESKKRIDGPLDNILSKSQYPEEALITSCTTSQIGKAPWNIEKCRKGSSNNKTKSTEIWEKIRLVCRQAIILWYRQTTTPEGWEECMVGVLKGKFGDTGFVNALTSLLTDCFTSHEEWIESNSREYKKLGDRVDERVQKALKADNATAAKAKLPTNITETEEPFEETQQPPSKRVKRSAQGPSNRGTQIVAAVNKTLTTEIISLLKQVGEIDREHRFYEALLTIQTNTTTPCQNCKEDVPNKDDLNTLKSCGHILCGKCVTMAKKDRSCVISDCDGQVVQSKIVPGTSLVNEDQATNSSKLNRLVQIIRNIPQDELALIFVQIGHLMPVASDALKAANIDHRMVTSSSLKVITEFIEGPKPKKGQTQVPPRPKALILNLGSSMAAGLNLQCANHVIFLSPLFVSTQHDWEAGMTQAIGRARRYGQQRDVHVYHLLVKNTCEINIFQKRHTSKLVDRSGVPTLLPEDQVLLEDDTLLEGEYLPDDVAG